MPRQTQAEIFFRIVEEMLEMEMLEMERKIRRDHLMRQRKVLANGSIKALPARSAEGLGNFSASLRPMPTTGATSKWHQPE